MIRFRHLAIGALLIATTTGFTGCQVFQSSPGQSQGIAAACASIAASEDVLTAVNRAGKLTAAQYDAVLKAIAVKAKVCNVSPMPTSIAAATYQELLGAQSSMTAAAQGVH